MMDQETPLTEEPHGHRTDSILPTVAVLLSTYNGTAFLKAQLESLANQESVTVQVFARDDGSTDDTVSLLQSYAYRWPALARPVSDRNIGPAASFMELLRIAPGDFDYYAFCDQDDVWLHDKLSRAVQKLNLLAIETPTIYCSSVTCVDSSLNSIGNTILMGDGSFSQIMFANIACGNTMVMNAQAARLLRSREPSGAMIMHDWWCALVISAFGHVVCDEESRILYRQHELNLYGSAPRRLPGLLIQFRKFVRDPRRFYPVREQVAEFVRLYGNSIPTPNRILADNFINSNRSVVSRLSYAAFGRIDRWDVWGSVGTRVLIAAGLY